MASLQRLDQAPRKKRWLPIAIVTAIAVGGAITYSVLDESEEQPTAIRLDTGNSDTEHSVQEAYTLMQKGLYRDALKVVNQALKIEDTNMNAQLLQASLLAKVGNVVEAEQRLNALHKQYPDRPEPLNNLAVLYAEAGDSNRAIQTLQKAFKTHPSYDQVYRNLGDMYAVLAADAYNKALGLSKTEAGPQLAILDRFGTPTAITATNSLPALASVASTDSKNATVSSVVLAQPEPVNVVVEPSNNAVEDTPLASTESTSNDSETAIEITVAPSAVPAATDDIRENTTDRNEEEAPTSAYTNVVLEKADSEAIAQVQASAEQTIASKPEAVIEDEISEPSAEEIAIARETERAAQLLASLESGADLDVIDEELEEPENTAVVDLPPAPEARVSEHLTEWAKAWSAQDVDGYLRAYVAGYKPNNTTSHKQWADQRRSRLSRPTFIKVELSDIDVTMLSDNRAEVTFRQSYRSDRYRDVERKKVSLMRRSSGWKIVSEGKL